MCRRGRPPVDRCTRSPRRDRSTSRLRARGQRTERANITPPPCGFMAHPLRCMEKHCHGTFQPHSETGVCFGGVVPRWTEERGRKVARGVALWQTCGSGSARAGAAHSEDELEKLSSLGNFYLQFSPQAHLTLLLPTERSIALGWAVRHSQYPQSAVKAAFRQFRSSRCAPRIRHP